MIFSKKNRKHRLNRLNRLNQRLNPYITASLRNQGFFLHVLYIAGSTELVNSNMLSEFLRERRELPWQPNLGTIAQIQSV